MLMPMPQPGHKPVFTRLQAPNALLKIVTAARALKVYHVSIDIRHQSCFFLQLFLQRLASYRAVSLILRRAMINVASSYGTASLFSRALGRQAS
jgi:hypothetical protein